MHTGAISGLRAYSRSLNQEEITASYASCTGNYSDIMMWSPHPRSVHLPSRCDGKSPLIGLIDYI